MRHTLIILASLIASSACAQVRETSITEVSGMTPAQCVSARDAAEDSKLSNLAVYESRNQPADIRAGALRRAREAEARLETLGRWCHKGATTAKDSSR